MRVGQGFDAHRLVAGRPLVLCGVTIAHEKGLDGHSDADVAVHALIDALLGAAGLGDIGRHFPDSDPAYKGICSMALLSRVVQMLQARAGQVLNCDVTIVAQRPKIAPYIEEMARNLARALLVDADCVNVKATTTERMGYEGREEGISASAVTLVSFS
ncbi:MAG: 2-C-methyl-D-erythritol 2,4-cyclodiphosphate synthase [Clostridia bacterium]